MYSIILVIHVFLAIALVGIILLQRPDGNSLAGLSGGNNMGFLSGRATGNLLTKMTSIMAVLFIITSLSLAVFSRGSSQHTAIIEEKPVTEKSEPAAPRAPLADEASPKTTPQAPVSRN